MKNKLVRITAFVMSANMAFSWAGTPVFAEEGEASAGEIGTIAFAQCDSYVNIRSSADADSEVTGKIYNNCAATIVGKEGDWYQITSGNCTGYVKCEFVVVGDEELAKSVSTRLATVTTQTLYVREQPTTESSVEGMVPEGDDLVVTDESMADTGWVKVSLLEYEGYVSLEFVTLSTDYVTAESKEEEAARLAKEEAERKAAAAAAAQAAEWANKMLVTVDENSSLNIRKEASQDAEVVGKFYHGSGAEVLEVGAEWTKVKSGDVE